MKGELIFKERDRDMENVFGMMALIMRVSGLMEKEMGQEYILKKMEFYIKANGRII
jgi:hypothetical protein